MTNRYLGIVLTVMVLISSCKKDGYQALSDAPAEVPIIVSSPIYAYRPNPTILASKLQNKISFTLEIPAGNPRSIKEITKIATGATGNFTIIRDSLTVRPGGIWVNTAIPVNGKSYTFNTTFDEFKVKAAVSAVPTSNALLSRDFYFQVKLDNDQILYPISIRVWVTD